MRETIELVVPEFHLPIDVPITISSWLVPRGSEVIEGDRVVELLFAEFTFDVPSPVSGRLTAILAGTDEVVQPGQPIARIRIDD